MEQRELDLTDILTGLELGQLIARAQAQVQALTQAQSVYVAHLRRKYEVHDDWQLNDWAQGFVRPVAAEEAEEMEINGD